MATVNYQARAADIRSRIQKERKMMEACKMMKAATPNPEVQNDLDKKIRESQRMISYFEASLRDLEDKSAAPGMLSAKTLPPTPNLTSPSLDSRSTADFSSSSRSVDQTSRLTPSTSVTSLSNTEPPERRKPHLSNLDLIKADTPLTAAKISRMLHQLDFKLTVEKQYKDVAEKMARLYQADGDKKSKQDAESKRVESNQKMLLLNNALKKYKTLDVMGDIDEEDDATGDLKGMLRKPLTGAFQVTVLQARDLDRPPIASKFSLSSSSKRSKPESVVVIKIEDTPRARTHLSRNDKWNEEFDIHVDKANEVEVTIYDKAAGELPIPIGLLWVRLSDVVEELRRKKAGQSSSVMDPNLPNVPGNQAWVPASRVDTNQRASASFGEVPVGQQVENAFPAPNQSSVSEGVTAWFAVEPEGQIELHINFVKSNVRKRPYDAVGGGLGRQGAVRKRKEEVHEQNGHKFLLKQFYTVILCAYCREFLLNAAGMQCEDCKYVCHKKCFSHVVTKCISKSNAETDKDEEKINHRIPHRFEPISSLSPNWCCHCGMILPLGRKKARKCSECDLTAHTDCVHLVPDFCGMSMEMANQLLMEVKSINSHRQRPSIITAPKLLPSNASQDHLADATGRMRIDGTGRGHSPSPSMQMAPSPVWQQSPLPLSAGDNYQPPMELSPQSAHVPKPTRSPQSGNPSPTGPPNQHNQFPLQQQQGYALPQPQQQIRPENRYAAPVQQSDTQDRPQQQLHKYSSYGGPDVPQAQANQGHSGRPLPPAGASRPPQMQQTASMPQPQQRPSPNQAPYPSQPLPPNQQFMSQQGPHQQQRPPQPLQPISQYSSQVSVPPLQMQQPPRQPFDPRRSQQQVAQPPTKRMPSKRKIGLDDFNFLAVLGKGNFGKVMLAEEKATSQLYAIKVLKKDFIVENDEIESTKSEKRVFLAAAKERHPFLLGLHSCFQTETRVYFCMEFVPGGDLMLHIQRKQFSPRQAKFYGAEVLLALEYFHKNGIVYRDLKLDNIMLTLDGHVKVADYGLCKEDMWYGKTTSTFCGTPEFMAPEILLEQRYGRAVDWWAFGVLIYEMLLGQSPFRGEDEDEIFDAILEDEPLYPMHMPGDSVSILQKLLTRDPTKRLGAGEDDSEPIKRHAFFRDVNWDDLFHKRIPPPFYPTVGSATDVSNFDPEFTAEKPNLTPVHSQLSGADQREFEGFSWTAPWVVQQ